VGDRIRAAPSGLWRDPPVLRSTHYCVMRSSVPDMDSTQLLKGALDLAVLAVVDAEDGYGYDVVRRLRAAGLEEVGDASVYGTLRRLYSAGSLTSYVVPSESGPHRKYYGITPVGRAELKRQSDDWRHFSEAVGRLLDTTGSTR
jgi:PadR family transcriptional regulator PadR